jgi:outer membrane lipoprotein-sorting protein
MKKCILLILTLILFSNAFTQSKKELEDDLKSTKAKLDSFQTLYFQQQSQYQQKIVYLESIIDKVRFVLGSTLPPNNSFSTLPNQIIGNNNIESIKSQIGDVKQNTPLKLGEGDGLTPKTGGTIYTGSRGGQYYINKNGTKTYIKRKK